MGKKYWVIINRTRVYLLYWFIIFLAMPDQLFAIPRSITRIVRTFQGQNKQKESKQKGDGAASLSADGRANNAQPVDQPVLSNAQQARLAIDEAIKDNKLANHPATWYYRGVIYDRLLRDDIASEKALTLLDEALAAYEKAKQLSLSKSKQFHSFALSNLAALWRYFLNRGMGYYRQEAFDQSIAQFAICRRILPDEPTPLLYTAIVHHSLDQSEEALRYYQDYLAVKGPQFAVARAMAAIYYHKLKDFDKAIAILNEALLQFPCNNELLEEMCLIHSTAGRIDAYAASLTAEGQGKEIHASYAYAYLCAYQGRIDEAIACYQQLLKAHPHQYDALRQMGFLFYNEAIKLYAHTLKSVGEKAQLENVTPADSCGLMHVMVRRLWPDAIGWREMGHLLPSAFFSSGWPFAPSLVWVVYDHPFVKHSKISSFVDLVQSGNLPYTTPLYGYIHTKNATALARNKWAQTIRELEKYLKEALYYLKSARVHDKKDKAIAQALYYSYYYLKQYGPADRLLQAMQKQKQYLDEDPFTGHKDKDS
ncbi:tetratricopeptide repeat protein [Cardinium endosymbiont of Nabis limbatus]|uniref:tetratricopeptide repeat protein n=1 Tax=Cardinium endosymbiont of Nabis limbatus TaxID=3066217 RepID=UPI003AF3FA93